MSKDFGKKDYFQKITNDVRLLLSLPKDELCERKMQRNASKQKRRYRTMTYDIEYNCVLSQIKFNIPLTFLQPQWKFLQTSYIYSQHNRTCLDLMLIRRVVTHGQTMCNSNVVLLLNLTYAKLMGVYFLSFAVQACLTTF